MAILTTIILDVNDKIISHNSITGPDIIVSGEDNITNIGFNFNDTWTNYSRTLIIETPKGYIASPYVLNTTNFTVPNSVVDGYGLLKVAIYGSNTLTNTTIVTKPFGLRVEGTLPINGGTLPDEQSILADIIERLEATETFINGTPFVNTLNGLQSNIGIFGGLNINVNTAYPANTVTIATNNVISVTGLKFNTNSPSTAILPGDMAWNNVDGTVDLKVLNGSMLQLGQETYFYAKATEAINNGEAVQFAGVEGDHLTVKNTVPSDLKANPTLFMGVATHNMTQGKFGYITAFGKVNNVYTTGWTLGDLLYCDPINSGKLTNQEPEAPNAKILVAAVIKLATGAAENGIIMVRPTFVGGIVHLDDVHIQNIQNDDILRWSNTNARWENVAASLGGGYTGSQGYVGSQGIIGYTGSAGTDGGLGYTGSTATSADTVDGYHVVQYTASNYAALGSKDGNTIYLIVG